ncbi:MAG: hypothetical protein Q9166_007755 [cf. Caloplaca sp. 2 TL-2023]
MLLSSPTPSVTFLLTLLILLHSAHSTPHSRSRGRPTGAGINCEGSSQCSFTTVNSPNILAEFNSTLITGNGTSPSAHPSLPSGPLHDLELFFTGEHIICARNLHWLVGSICVFLQGAGVPATGVPASVIKRLVNQMVYHGCKFCGSVPVSEDNDPFQLGLLTSNYVMDEGCHGVCDQGRKKFYYIGRGNWTVGGARRMPGG